MSEILISIKPNWCELIAIGIKTIEVRKSKPRFKPPFKCYIYESRDGKRKYYDTYHKTTIGKVIGEFVCDSIYELAPLNHAPDDVEQQACLTREEIVRYLKGGGYGWHISNLVIYGEPKELGEFFADCGDEPKCGRCEYYYYECSENGTYEECGSPIENYKPLKRPPQSWRYCERKEQSDEIN